MRSASYREPHDTRGAQPEAEIRRRVGAARSRERLCASVARDASYEGATPSKPVSESLNVMLRLLPNLVGMSVVTMHALVACDGSRGDILMCGVE